MIKTHYSVPIHPRFYDDMKREYGVFNDPFKRVRADFEGALLTWAEFLSISEAGRQTCSLGNIPQSIIVHKIDFDNASVDITFSDTALGRHSALQEETGGFDIEKHFFAVPRLKQFLCSDIAVRTNSIEMIAVDLVAREGMFRGPDRWLEHRLPIKGQVDPTYTDMDLCIRQEGLSMIEDYNFKGDEHTMALLTSGQLKMELRILPSKSILNTNATRFSTIDPNNAVGTIKSFDVYRGRVFAKILTETLTRLDHENGGCAGLCASPRGFGEFTDGIPKITIFVTFDLGVIKK